MDEPLFGKGFWVTLIGGAAGAVMVGIAGGFVGQFFIPPGAGLEGLAWVLGGAVVGGWVGSVLGAYAALSIASDPKSRATAGWLTVFVPLLIGGGGWLAVSWTDADDFGSSFVPYCIVVASVIATVLSARRLAR